MAEALYFCRRPQDYGLESKPLDVGQVLTLEGCRNDKRLIEQTQFVEVPRGTSIVQCGRCGARFITDAHLHQHGQKRHEPLTDVQKLEAAEREDKFVEVAMPLKPRETIEVQTVPAPRRRGRPRKVHAVA